MQNQKTKPLNVDLSKIIKKENAHPLLENAIIRMISTSHLPYYGEFALFVTFIEAKIGTCGVSVNKNGNMIFYWDPEWVSKQSMGSTIFVMVHEIFHLLFSHIKRTVGYNKNLSNVAQDMIINSIIYSDLMLGEKLGPGYENFIEVPLDDDGKNTALFVPKEYDGPWVFESLYKWLKEEYKEWKEENSDKCNDGKLTINVDKDGNMTMPGKEDEGGEQEEDGENGDQESGNEKGKEKLDSTGKPIYGPYAESDYQDQKSGEKRHTDIDCYSKEHIFEGLESSKGLTLDCHFDDEVPEEIRREVVNSVMQNLKNRGLETSDIAETLRKLQKSEKDYLKYIKRSLSHHVFGTKKMKSITKPNRRGIWGLKGNRKYKTKINCILDTSGSMSGEFEKALAYIFQNDISVNLIQCDTEVKDFIEVTDKNQLNQMEIKGLGGTTLTPGIKYIANNKDLNKLNTVILTDGYVDQLDFTGVKGKVLIISNSVECPILKSNNKIKQIIIDKSND